jgi:hypothetical protein
VTLEQVRGREFAGANGSTVPGRLWAVRLAAHGHPSAGITVVVCAHPRCVSLPATRYTQTSPARRAALHHLAGHARSAGAPAPGTYCRCRLEEHPWHNAAAHPRCAGPVVLTLAADIAHTSWRLVETCTSCATATPRTTVLTPAPRGPAVEATPPRQPPGPLRPGPPPATTTSAPVATASGPKPRATAKKPRPLLLTAHQMGLARAALAYLRTVPAPTPESRLLALVLILRAAGTSRANLTGTDLTALRLPDPGAALTELVDTGIIVTAATVEQILTTTPADPALITLPDLAHPGRLALSNTARPRISGWATRLLAAKPLRSLPCSTRLLTLYLTSHADHAGAGTLDAHQAAATAGLPATDPADALTPHLIALVHADWLTTTPHPDGHYQLTQTTTPHLTACH